MAEDTTAPKVEISAITSVLLVLTIHFITLNNSFVKLVAEVEFIIKQLNLANAQKIIFGTMLIASNAIILNILIFR